MRKWLRRARRALVDMYDQRRAQVAKTFGTVVDMRVVCGEIIATTDEGVVSAGRWPPVHGGTTPYAIRMRREHRVSRQLRTVTRAVRIRLAPSIASLVSPSNAILRRLDAHA